MECEELYDAPNNPELLEQELPLEDFGDCELKSKPYVGMQFDSLDGVETFYKEFATKEGFGIRVRTSKRPPRSDNITSYEDEHHMSRALQSSHVCHGVSQLSYLAEKSEDIYEMIISDLDQTLKKAFEMENQLLEGNENDEMNMHHKSGESVAIVEVQDCSPNVPLNIKGPHVPQTKGQKKSYEKQGHGGRIKGGLEISLASATTKKTILSTLWGLWS
ncbi:hypothetical protein SO802_002463 [Lithocarpus litseifolius]|uniref:FAR1 domain-containing protein n=1 Tax=Lithocarpus litseifolius TaxID=425828 RepID=A0AAW2DYZ7_9ROSI